MKCCTNLLFILLFLSVYKVATSQVFMSNYTLLSIRDGALLSVRGDVLNQFNGDIKNLDTIDLTGNWENYNSTGGLDSTYTGIVRFTGDNQRIGGLSTSYFYHMLLSGTGIKYLDIDQRSYGILQLTDRELQTQEHIMWVKSTIPNAIEYTTGFVSSANDGGLQRNIDRIAAYVYPTGSSTSALGLRPVFIHSLRPDFQSYRCGLNAYDATIDGFDRNNKQRFLCNVNPTFYHSIYKLSATSPIDIEMQYKPSDGNYNHIAHYNDAIRWEVPDSVSTSSGTYESIRINEIDDFSDKAFALALASQPFGFAGADTSIYRGTSIQLLTTDSANATWFPDYNLSCSSCNNPIAKPDSTTTYYVYTELANGCINTDTIEVRVIQSIDYIDLFIPNIITPNSDGANDAWVINDLASYPNNEVIILNRWGDQVFTAKPYNNDFLGTLWGKPLPEATYYYLVKITVAGQVKTFDGPLTIMR